MINSELIQNIIVYAITYIPPLIVFIIFWERMKRNRLLLFIISIAYLVISVFTQNILPFILVIFDIIYLKREKRDYERYNFNIKRFNLFKGFRYAIFSYVITLTISIITIGILTKYSVPVKQQDVVSWMADMPLYRFLLTVPVAVIFAPVLEEFVFRWILFKNVFGRMGIKTGAVLSSLIFAAVHYNLSAFPMILWIGLYNCYLFEKKGYWYSVFNHMLFNSVTVGVLLMQKINM